MAKRKKSNNPAGRPSQGLSEAQVLVKCPAVLKAIVEESAKAEGISAAEWWRRAARLRLGWREVLEP